VIHPCRSNRGRARRSHRPLANALLADRPSLTSFFSSVVSCSVAFDLLYAMSLTDKVRPLVFHHSRALIFTYSSQDTTSTCRRSCPHAPRGRTSVRSRFAPFPLLLNLGYLGRLSQHILRIIHFCLVQTHYADERGCAKGPLYSQISLLQTPLPRCSYARRTASKFDPLAGPRSAFGSRLLYAYCALVRD
jgi:hypothetical protein